MLNFAPMSSRPFASIAVFLLLAACAPVLSAQRVDVDTTTGDRSNAPERWPIFFPPLPPALGGPPALPLALDLGYPAPTELAPFVGEFFYPPLSSLFAEQKVTKKLHDQLESFLVRRRQLETALISHLAATAALDPAARDNANAELRAAQQPSLDALEYAAEQIRLECISAGSTWDFLFGKVLHKIQESNQAAIRRRNFEFTLAAAFYAEGLVPAQRGLLCALALEVGDGIGEPEPPLVVTNDRRLEFFLPAPARIALPVSLPTPVDEN